jgi:hypothetical protein
MQGRSEGPDSLTTKLRALQVHVEQLGAEFKDPETTPERREALRTELAEWYDVCTRIMAQHHADSN